MRLSAFLLGFTASAALHAAGYPLLMWLAEMHAEVPARFPGQRVGVTVSLDVPPSPPPAKVRGPNPRLGVNSDPADPSKTKIAQDKFNRKPAAPGEKSVVKDDPKPKAATPPKSERKSTAEPKRVAQKPPKRQTKPEAPATFQLAQPISEVEPLDTTKNLLKRAPSPPVSTVQLTRPAPKTPSGAAEPEPKLPRTATATPTPAAGSQDSPIQPVAYFSSIDTAARSKRPSDEIVVRERRPTMASAQSVPHAEDTGLNAISLHPDKPTQRGKQGAKRTRTLGTDETLANFAGNVDPIYPPPAQRARIEGTVVLRLRVARTGRITNVEVVQSSGHAILDEAAVDGISTWTGVPRTRYGQPIASVEILYVNFGRQR
jgi:protein TonB